jgi:hypothetical protein
MVISANFNTILFRVILLPFLLWLNYVPLKRFLLGHFEYSNLKWVFLFAILIFLYFLIVVVLSLFGIIGVNLDEKHKIISVKYFLRTEIFNIEDIEGYVVTYFKTRWKEYEGIILKLKNGRSVELSEYNLESLYDFNQYLIKNGVVDLGKKKSWFPFKRKI